MKRVRLFEWSGGSAFFYQWGRLKRRERNLHLFIYVLWALHILFWVLWATLIAPNPIALTVPLGISLGPLSFLRDFLWPILALAFVAVNTWLVFVVYHKDILAAWLLLGATIFTKVIVLGITVSLIVIAT